MRNILKRFGLEDTGSKTSDYRIDGKNAGKPTYAKYLRDTGKENNYKSHIEYLAENEIDDIFYEIV